MSGLLSLDMGSTSDQSSYFSSTSDFYKPRKANLSLSYDKYPETDSSSTDYSYFGFTSKVNAEISLDGPSGQSHESSSESPSDASIDPFALNQPLPPGASGMVVVGPQPQSIFSNSFLSRLGIGGSDDDSKRQVISFVLSKRFEAENEDLDRMYTTTGVYFDGDSPRFTYGFEAIYKPFTDVDLPPNTFPFFGFELNQKERSDQQSVTFVYAGFLQKYPITTDLNFEVAAGFGIRDIRETLDDDIFNLEDIQVNQFVAAGLDYRYNQFMHIGIQGKYFPEDDLAGVFIRGGFDVSFANFELSVKPITDVSVTTLRPPSELTLSIR